jgi:hypothetical protein
VTDNCLGMTSEQNNATAAVVIEKALERVQAGEFRRRKRLSYKEFQISAETPTIPWIIIDVAYRWKR